MITEDFEICPHCSFDKMLIRYGSWGYFQYNACPKCGFAEGGNSDKNFTTKEIWKLLTERFSVELTKYSFPISRHGIYLWVETLFGRKPKSWRIA